MTVATSPIQEAVLQLEQIPPLSPTASELLRVAANPELDAKELSAILERDPPLAARIIGLANSAFFGQSRPVLGMDDAIIRVLGLDMVRSLALSMALVGSLDTSRCPAYDLRHYWVLALGTGSLARDLALAMARPEVVHPDGAYLCGLVHTLGELALLHLRPDLMCEVVHQHRDDPSLDPIELQREILGVDCWQAGEQLACRWHLPEQVQDAIGFFGSGAYQGPHQALVQVVAASRTWVLASLAGELPVLEAPDAAAEEFQRIVGRFHAKLGELRALAAAMS